jgi:hypothetical protein
VRLLLCSAGRFGTSARSLITRQPNEQHWIALICPRKNAVSLAMSVNEVHDFSNFGHGSGFKLVFSLDLSKPVFQFERMHGESAFPLPPRKNPAI